MPGLMKTVVPVSFAGGLSLKEDALQVVPGKFLALENAIFQSPKKLSKRNGYKAFPTTFLAGNDNQPVTFPTPDGRAIATLRDELLVFTSGAVGTWDPEEDAFFGIDLFSSVTLTQTAVDKGPNDASRQDEAKGNGYQFDCWSENTSIKFRIAASTGSIALPIENISNFPDLSAKPKVVFIDNRFILFYLFKATGIGDWVLRAKTIPTANLFVDHPSVDITFGVGNTRLDQSFPNYDVCVDPVNHRIYLAFSNHDNGFTVYGFDPPYDLTSPDQANTAAVAGGHAEAVNIFTNLSTSDVNGGPTVSYWDGFNVNSSIYDFSLAGATTKNLGPFDSALAIAGVCFPEAIYRSAVIVTSYDSIKFNTFSQLTEVKLSGIDSGSPMRSVGLAAKPFVVPTGIIFDPFQVGCLFAYQSAPRNSPNIPDLQTCYFLMDASNSGVIRGRILYGLGGGLLETDGGIGAPMVPETMTLSPTSFSFPVLFKNLLTTNPVSTQVGQQSNTPVYWFSERGVLSIKADYQNPQYSYLKSSLAETLHLSGGILTEYVGNNILTENNFALYPDISATRPGVTPNPTIFDVGGTINAGAYQWVFCYEWTDPSGQLWRSAPSIPLSGTATTDTTAVTFTIPTLRVGKGSSNTSANGVVIVAYRTSVIGSVPGTIFYRCTNTETPSQAPTVTNAPIVNNGSQDTVTFRDEMVSTDIIARPQLYTTGGVVANQMPGPISAMAVNYNRLFALSSMSPLTVFFSKQNIPGTPVEFAAQFTLNIDPRGGDVTALGAMDDKLILFKESSIFMITGDGPDNTNQNNTFSAATLITTDCGCKNPRSVVIVPNGLMYQSLKGIYLLGRDLSVIYVGADVESFNSAFITSAQLIPNTNQVRFTMEGGGFLVYDYYVNQWSVFTRLKAADSTLWREGFIFIEPTGRVMQETPGIYNDAGAFITMKATTSWLALGGLGGFQRIFKTLLTGTFYSPHKLQVNIAYDNNSGNSQNIIIDPFEPGEWGSDPSWGFGAQWGGDGRDYAWRIYPNQHKCTSMQLTFSDLQNGTEIGQSMSLSGISLEVGLKKGVRKLGHGQTWG